MSNLTLLISRLCGTPCSKARKWLATLPPETTPEEAWKLCPVEGWRSWVRASLPDNDPEWDDLAERLPGLRPPPPPPVPKSKAPRRDPNMETRCFFARLAGKVRTVTYLCNRCHGNGCRACDRTGKVREEALHSADAYTIAALNKIPPGAGRKPVHA